MADRIARLQLKAAQCRRNVVRMVEASHHGHLGGAMSCLDIVTALYFDKMNIMHGLKRGRAILEQRRYGL